MMHPPNKSALLLKARILFCRNGGEGQKPAAAHRDGGNSRKWTLWPPVAPVPNVLHYKRTLLQKQQLSECCCWLQHEVSIIPWMGRYKGQASTEAPTQCGHVHDSWVLVLSFLNEVWWLCFTFSFWIAASNEKQEKSIQVAQWYLWSTYKTNSAILWPW